MLACARVDDQSPGAVSHEDKSVNGMYIKLPLCVSSMTFFCDTSRRRGALSTLLLPQSVSVCRPGLTCRRGELLAQPLVSLYRSVLLLEGRARRRRPQHGGMAPHTGSSLRPRLNHGTNEACRAF